MILVEKMAYKPIGTKRSYGHPGKHPGRWERGTVEEVISPPWLGWFEKSSGGSSVGIVFKSYHQKQTSGGGIWVDCIMTRCILLVHRALTKLPGCFDSEHKECVKDIVLFSMTSQRRESALAL